jgi:hypothetical protein
MPLGLIFRGRFLLALVVLVISDGSGSSSQGISHSLGSWRCDFGRSLHKSPVTLTSFGNPLRRDLCRISRILVELYSSAACGGTTSSCGTGWPVHSCVVPRYFSKFWVGGWQLLPVAQSWAG